MILSENIKMAVSAIRSARFRSLLTMFGIIIGVVSVVTTASLGEGIKRQISGQANTVGKDLIIVRPGNLVKRDDQGKITGLNLLSFLSSSTISQKDLETIGDNPLIETAVPFSVISAVPSIGQIQFEEGFVMATTDQVPKVMAQKVQYGNFFEAKESGRASAVIGAGVAEKLFEENVPIGKSLQIRGEDFIVRGVFERLASNPVSPEADYNNAVFIPYESGRKITGEDLKIYEILARPKVKSPQKVDEAMASINAGLKKNHGGQEDFTVLRQEELATVADNLLNLITFTVTAMAAVALFVGGVGIMNVMLASVTERKREIGIRKAVGATNRQIQAQFLIEAVMLSGLGALIGVLLSYVVSGFFLIFTDLRPIITWQVLAVAVCVSVLVGIIFGLIPAVKASRRDPIEALRSF